MNTLDGVERILRDSRRAMSVREILAAATGDRALPTKSKTPDTVVARDLAVDIKRHGERSRFIRTAPGRFAMREIAVIAAAMGAPL